MSNNHLTGGNTCRSGRTFPLTLSTATTASFSTSPGHEHETFHLANGHRASPPTSRNVPVPPEEHDRNPPRRAHLSTSQPPLFVPRAQMTAWCMKTWRHEQSSMSQSRPETDDLETFARRRSSQTGQHDGDSSSSQGWASRGYFHMQRVSIPAALHRLFSRTERPLRGKKRSLAKRENLTSRRSLNLVFNGRSISSALEGRLCKIAAPIQRGIEAPEYPLAHCTHIAAALSFMKQPPAAKNTQS